MERGPVVGMLTYGLTPRSGRATIELLAANMPLPSLPTFQRRLQMEVPDKGWREGLSTQGVQEYAGLQEQLGVFAWLGRG